MNEKMIRFLKSIHIENYDDFDIDFEMLGKNRFNPNQWDMIIVKETPWKYSYLHQFIDHLQFVNYKYTLQFSYLSRPTKDDVLNVFRDWYLTIYRMPLQLDVSVEDDVIKVVYKNEEEANKTKSIIKDFGDFLNFISYEFVIVEETKKDDDIKLSKKEMKQITKEAEAEAKDAIKESVEEAPDVSYYERSPIDQIEQDHQTITAQVEDAMLKQMKRNAREMAKERERIRLNKRGNYMPYDLIDAIDTNSGNVDINGTIFSIEQNEYGGKVSLTLGINDTNGGAIYARAYEGGALSSEQIKELKKGVNIRVRGAVYYDEFGKSLTIRVHYIDLLPPDEIEEEKVDTKRVELHLHTLMSTQDGVCSITNYCQYAKALGHKAIAITDHGVVQSFPEAHKSAKQTGLKMIYGCELYMVDDQLKYVFNPKDIELNKATFVVLDLETTGLSTRHDRIIQFGAVKVEKGTQIGKKNILINPRRKLDQKIIDITDITNEMLEGKPTIEEVLPEIVEFVKGAILVTHNASFDFGFLNEELKRCNMPILTNPVIDTLALSRYLFPNNRNHRLGTLCRNMEVKYDENEAHRADYDAIVLNEVWQPMLAVLCKDNLHLKHSDLANLKTPTELLKHIYPLHVTALVKNKKGLKDLYKIVSKSHIEYFSNVPKIPRRELETLRSDLLLGSSCFNGEIFRTARTESKEKLKELMKFYDFIEIQPLENYSYLVNMGELDEEQLKRVINDIIEAADELHKPIVATGDVHYLRKEDKVFRDVYIYALAVGKVSHPLNPISRKDKPHFENPDQHFRSTPEMLECFSYLGEDRAYEFVVTNTNKIADQIEEIEPIPSDKLYTPKIDNCENMLTEICYKKAHEIYGDPLPEYIEKRLKAELDGIIMNGFSVIYYIAHRIVKKAYDDGFLVGSRGSVGSSFVATMAGITEVNPLPPHYICPNCKHLEWTNETQPDVRSGYDLEDKFCPVCHNKMIHDGQNIPFETFLGFKAEKTPDIDLNFPGDYQARAHEYTKVLLGESNVYRAGTIETVAEKTAFGFARGYLERTGVDLTNYPKSKIAYLASGCVNVKRTTGQHPGGIVVIPSGYDVYDFTPAQYPADEKDASWKTTHFDFHSLHDTILKLDLLGHVDPAALKMMCNLTNINIKDIPLNDKDVLSIFSSADALKMSHNYLAQRTGAMGIPEFGTETGRGILETTMPKTFSDLVIISGLAHGEGVWAGNAEKLIREGKATLREVIGCRDDIMTYLIGKGLPSSVAFSIMEDVRKGRGLKPEYIEIMRANKVPSFYIDSCNLIKYMFPKGHATAYVMMAIRVGYFKIHYPLEFYATFFTLRSKQYEIATMIKGEQAIIDRLEKLKTRERSKTAEALNPKEKEILKTLQMSIEMVQRGFKFSNLDLYKSDAVNFVVDHETNSIIPPFITLDGLGENAGISVVEARKQGKFTSKDDLLRRTKLTSTNVKDLEELGVLEGLNDNDQLSLFDF